MINRICLSVFVSALITTLVDRVAVAQGGGQGGPALVEVAEVVAREVASGQTFVGTVMPPRRAVIGSAVDGRVVEVLFEEGDRVEKNEPLAQLLTETIQLELEAAEAELDLRRQQLAEMENGSLPEEIEQARSRMEQTRVSSEFRQKEYQRLSLLDRQRATSASELDAALSMAQEGKEAYLAAKAAYELAVQGPRPEKIAQARAQVAMQDAIVRRLQDQIKKYTLFSRFDGYVTVKHTDLGEWVTQGDPIAEVIALDEVDVVVKVVDSQASFVQPGDSVRVEIPALRDLPWTGSVEAVVPQADVRSRTFPVRVRVENEILKTSEPLLKAGMLARATLATGPKVKARLVPKDALVLGGPQPMIWLIDPNSASRGESGKWQAGAVATMVQLGVADGELIQVTGPIADQAWVVVKGNERIILSRTGEPSPVTWADVRRGADRSDVEKAKNDAAH
jgi:multidrug efflux pump subunit AcrA (membrane-fusion protein)